MKILLIMCIYLAFIGCHQSHQCNNKLSSAKYNVGDVVYVKPDSQKVVIKRIGGFCREYEISYSFRDRYKKCCRASDIYGKVK